MKSSRISILIVATILMLAGAACSSSTGVGSGSISDPLAPSTGSVTVRVHDDPAANIESAMITFDSVHAIAEGGALEEVQGFALGEPVDLATLVGEDNSIVLAQGALPFGTYTGIQLAVAAVQLQIVGADPVELPMPGSMTFAVPITFVVEEGMDTVIMIDIPLGSFQIAGTDWTFNPQTFVHGSVSN